MGSESRSDAIGIRRTRLAPFIRRLEESTPTPDERAPMTVARGRPQGRGRIILLRPARTSGVP